MYQKSILAIFVLMAVLSSVHAQSIEVIAPSEVVRDEAFEIELYLSDFEPEPYDVKIDMLSPSESRIGKISLDGEEWTSTYYYLEEAIAEGQDEATFFLRAENYVGPATFEIKLRKPSGQAKSYGMYSLEVVNMEDDLEEIDEEVEEEVDEEDVDEKEGDIEEDERNEDEESDAETVEPEITLLQTPQEHTQSVDPSPIALTPQTINSAPTTQTKQRREWNGGFLALGSFCVLLLVLLVLRYLQDNKKNHGIV